MRYLFRSAPALLLAFIISTPTFGVVAGGEEAAGPPISGSDGSIVERLKATTANSAVTIARPGSGSGTVVGNSGAINCGATCTDTYADGTSLTLTATADAGSQFTGWLGKCMGTGTCQFTINGAATVTATFATNGIGSPRIDVDGNGTFDALTDGLLIIRYLFGLTGNSLISGAVGTGATRTTATQITSFLVDIKPLLDIDGNLTPDALTDGLLTLRYMFGLRGAALIAQAVGAGASRTTSTSIEAILQGLTLPTIGVSVATTIDLLPGLDVLRPKPMALNHATHKLYVGGQHPHFQTSSAVKVIDTTNNTVVAAIALGRYAVANQGIPVVEVNVIAVDESPAPGGNRIYTAGFSGTSNQNFRIVFRSIDGATNTVLNGQGNDLFLDTALPTGMVVSPTSHKVYYMDGVGNVTVIDGPNSAVLTSLSTGVGASGPHSTAIVLNPATNKVFVFGSSGGAVINGATDTVAPLAVNFKTTGSGAINLANGLLYLVGLNNSSVPGIYVLDNLGAQIDTWTAGVPADATQIAFDSASNTVYVGGPGGPIVAFDAATRAVKGSFARGTYGLAFDSPNGGRLYSVNQDSYDSINAVDVSNPANGALQTVTVANRPHDVAINSTTNRIYLTDQEFAEVVVLDGSTRTVAGRIPIAGSGPGFLSGNNPSRLHIAVSSALDRVYVSRIDSQYSSYVDILDGTTRALLQTLTINPGNGNTSLPFIAVDDTNRRLYVAQLGSPVQSLIVYNLDTNALVTTVPLPALSGPMGGIAVNPVTRRVYVDGGNGLGGNNVAIVNGTTNQFVKMVSAGAVPGQIAVNTVTNKVYVANTGAGSVDNSVTEIDGATDTVESSILNTTANPSGDQVGSVAVDEGTNKIFVGDIGIWANNLTLDYYSRVSVFAGATKTFLGQLDVGLNPISIAVNQTTHDVFVANSEDGTVSVLAKP